MSFRDDLLRTIKEAITAKEAEEQGDRDFEAFWRKLKDGVIRPLFQEAAAIISEMQEHKGEANLNGSISLNVGSVHDKRLRHNLTFKPLSATREIERTVDSGEPLKFSPETLSKAAVEAEIHSFISAALSGKNPDA